MNESNKHPLSTRILHWLSTSIILVLIVLGLWMVDLSYYHEWYVTAPMLHKSIGILFSIIIVVRIINALQKPLPYDSSSVIKIRIAKLTHFTMYLIMGSLIITGFLISTADGRGISVFNLFDIPAVISYGEDQAEITGWLHQYFAYGLIALIIIHVAASLHHHFILKNNVLKRML